MHLNQEDTIDVGHEKKKKKIGKTRQINYQCLWTWVLLCLEISAYHTSAKKLMAQLGCGLEKGTHAAATHGGLQWPVLPFAVKVTDLFTSR